MFGFFNKKSASNSAKISPSKKTKKFPTTKIKKMFLGGWKVTVSKDGNDIEAVFSDGLNTIKQSFNGVDLLIISDDKEGVTVITSYNMQHEERTINLKTNKVTSFPRH